MKIGGHPVDLVVDTGMIHSVVTQLWVLSHRDMQPLLGPLEVSLATSSLYLENAVLESIK
jgi:hypothetical protein